MRAATEEVQTRLLKVVGEPRTALRDPARDQLAREALLACASDWAFMVTKDSAADYARGRAATHTRRFHLLADAIVDGPPGRATEVAARLRRLDGPFGHLDARML